MLKLRDHADDILIGAGTLLLTIGMGMLRLYLAPITAGLALMALGVAIAWDHGANFQPKGRG